MVNSPNHMIKLCRFVSPIDKVMEIVFGELTQKGHLSSEIKRTVKDGSLWMKHQMLCRTEQNSLP